DGSVIVVEIAGGTLTRVNVDTGDKEVVAEPGGGPNGAAVGPDGAMYVCNNGGCFDWHEMMGLTFPGSPPPSSYPGRGSIQRVYLAETHTGRVWAWNVPSPGVAEGTNPLGPSGGDLLLGLPGFQLFDSLAVDGDGWVCVATLANAGITSVSPDGATVEHLATDD